MIDLKNIPKSIRKVRNEKCQQCGYRKAYAKAFDMHFDWIDCPYDCEYDYEHLEKELLNLGRREEVADDSVYGSN